MKQARESVLGTRGELERAREYRFQLSVPPHSLGKSIKFKGGFDLGFKKKLQNKTLKCANLELNK